MAPRVAVIATALLGCAVFAACGDVEPAAPVGIITIAKDVHYYPGCQNEPVTVDGTTWYPLASFAFADEVSKITDVARQAPPQRPSGFRSPQVAEPEPGDDIGTLVIYKDGVARFESNNGLVVWLTIEEQQYDWVC